MASYTGPDIQSRGRPSLEELLADDVTRAVMQADHVAAPEIRGLCRAVQSVLAQRGAWPPGATGLTGR